MLFEQITIIGVGLIGGSVGLAARTRSVARRVVGVGRDSDALKRGVERGAIDSFTTNRAAGVAEADLVVVCTPVDSIAEAVLNSAPFSRRGTVFTDGGSTKKRIVDEIGTILPPGVTFVGAHPLAGSERTGVENASAELFVNRVTVVTPTSQNAPAAIGRVKEFWGALGSRVVTMSPEEHDRALAITSHLPHAVAAGVAGATTPELLTLTAGGFRDVTRIASGDPYLWAAIFEANRDSVLEALTGFSNRLAEFRRLLEAGDGAGLVRWLTEAKQVRDALGS